MFTRFLEALSEMSVLQHRLPAMGQNLERESRLFQLSISFFKLGSANKQRQRSTVAVRKINKQRVVDKITRSVTVPGLSLHLPELPASCHD